MAKETIEQRQQRLLQSKLARQAREQEIIKGLPTLGAQAGWMGGLMAPSSGLTDYFGMYPEIPTEEKMMPTERLPSFSENIANKRYMDAMYQTLGVLGDAAYASAPFTGPAGLIGGTVLKGAGAIGKVSKGSKAKGIASLQEKSDLAKAVQQKQQEAMQRYATDYSDNVVAGSAGDLDYSSREIPFVSPTLEALIKRAPKNLKGKQVMEWVNANANKGVKPKEVEYLGIDEFIANNPNATVDEVIEGISENKISIQKSIYKSDDQKFLEFDITTPDTDPLDGSSLWGHRTDDIMYDLDRGDEYMREELLDFFHERNPQFNNIDKKKFTSIDELDSFLKKHNESMDDLADSYAEFEYDQNPYELIKPVSTGDIDANIGTNTFAFGNDDVGYQLFVDGHRIDIQARTGDIPYSRTEAQIQLRQAMSDYGDDYYRLEGEDDFATGATQFKEYIDNNLPGGDNYREVSFNWENAPKGHDYADHIEEDNQIAHALIRDRQLADGTDSLHIDELQSDVHKYGSKDGYELTPKQREQSINNINDSLKDTPYSFEETSAFKGIKKPNPNVEATFVEGHDFVDNDILDTFVEALNRIKSGKSKSDDYIFQNFITESGNQNVGKYLELKSADDIEKMFLDKTKAGESILADLDFYREHEDVLNLVRDLGIDKATTITKKLKFLDGDIPNYPFKDDWYNMGIKSLLMDAIEDGKDAISISTSAAMKNRYSDRYHKFYETLYDKKIPSAMQKLTKKYGGEFKKGKLDVENTYGADKVIGDVENPAAVIEAFEGRVLDTNIIKITPEMREKILKEGLQTFASGGVIGNLPSRLAKI